jgi:hypothetical protein
MCSTYLPLPLPLLLWGSINVMMPVCLSALLSFPFALARVHSVLACPSTTYSVLCQLAVSDCSKCACVWCCA